MATTRIVRTDNRTEFMNLNAYFEDVGITRQTSMVRTPQHNGIIERRNRTLNRSIIHTRFNKTPYELIKGRKLDISFLHVFDALCYPMNNREELGKLKAKGDIRFFIGYAKNFQEDFNNSPEFVAILLRESGFRNDKWGYRKVSLASLDVSILDYSTLQAGNLLRRFISRIKS
ncbi:retrovirus-related pol polyprotein from transposon TNT 1-94 [Tanacetum coccineum]|uniref:Retrovirus-related pol polyprotein from transposon TNT 1-94 n=1 Tax=Tanacetum coccineum TaxID=301880 RepID=A0ABQ5IWC6_9ASTR